MHLVLHQSPLRLRFRAFLFCGLSALLLVPAALRAEEPILPIPKKVAGPPPPR